MGNIFFLRIRGPLVFQPWLLAVCVLLCVRPGVLWRGGLVCRQCVSMWSMAPCIPFKNSCHVHEGSCFTLKIFGEKRVEKLMLGCEENIKHKCGTRWRNPQTNLLYKFTCCSDKNNCNWNPWIRPWKNFDHEEMSQFENLKSTEAPATTSKKPIQNFNGSNSTT